MSKSKVPLEVALRNDETKVVEFAVLFKTTNVRVKLEFPKEVTLTNGIALTNPDPFERTGRTVDKPFWKIKPADWSTRSDALKVKRKLRLSSVKFPAFRMKRVTLN